MSRRKKNTMLYKYIFTIILLYYITPSFSQSSEFDKGFITGYKKGYCYTPNPKIICSPPVFIPTAPYPKYPEKSSSWLDGYNRGLIVGMEQRKIDDLKEKTPPSPPTKFNPYIPQNPMSYPTQEQILAQRRAEEVRAAQSSQAVNSLINSIYEYKQRNPNRHLEIQQQRKQEKLDRYVNRKLSKKKNIFNKKRFSYTEYEWEKKYRRHKLTINIFSWTLSIGAIIALFPSIMDIVDSNL